MVLLEYGMRLKTLLLTSALFFTSCLCASNPQFDADATMQIAQHMDGKEVGVNFQLGDFTVKKVKDPTASDEGILHKEIEAKIEADLEKRHDQDGQYAILVKQPLEEGHDVYRVIQFSVNSNDVSGIKEIALVEVSANQENKENQKIETGISREKEEETPTPDAMPVVEEHVHQEVITVSRDDEKTLEHDNADQEEKIPSQNVQNEESSAGDGKLPDVNDVDQKKVSIHQTDDSHHSKKHKHRKHHKTEDKKHHDNKKDDSVLDSLKGLFGGGDDNDNEVEEITTDEQRVHE